MTEVELVGNALCLDVVNTVNCRPNPRRDWLGTPSGALTWARAAGRRLDESEADVLATLPQLRAAREAVYRVFQPLAQARRPRQADLDALTGLYGEAVARARLLPDDDGGGYTLVWPPRRTTHTLSWETAASAYELLTRSALGRLGECPTCGWLFLDTSRNGRRRWCSMATCGSRDKARRYYAAHADGPDG